MDIEKTMQFIAERQAATDARLAAFHAKFSADVDRFDAFLRGRGNGHGA